MCEVIDHVGFANRILETALHCTLEARESCNSCCCQWLAGTTLLYRPYFSRPRKSRRLFSEPRYWPRRSRGQYVEGNNQACIFEAEGKKSLIPGRLARSPLTCPFTRKVRDKSIVYLCSESCNASTGSPWLSGPKWFDWLFSTCNCQLADSPGG